MTISRFSPPVLALLAAAQLAACSPGPAPVQPASVPGAQLIAAGAGNLADELPARFGLATVAAGAVITWAGSASGKFAASGFDTVADAKFTTPGAIALDVSKDFAYVADTGNHCIETINLRTGEVKLLYGTPGTAGTTSKLNKPSAIVVDQTAASVPGYLYVADTGNNRVLKIALTGGAVESAISPTAASDAAPPTAGAASTLYIGNKPSGLAEDGSGNLFIADTGNHMVVQKEVDTGVGVLKPGVLQLAGAGIAGTTDATGLAASFNGPQGLAVNGTSLYVADTGNHAIRKVVTSSGVVTTVAGTKGSAGYTVSGTAAASAKFKTPAALAVDAAGTGLYVADTGNHCIRKVAIGGAVTAYVGSTLAATAAPKAAATNGAALSAAALSAPAGLVIKEEGGGAADLLIADTGNSRIRFRAR